MSQGVLGTTYRFYYVSKGLVSGLTNIAVKVRNPNEGLVGVYTLMEMVDNDFRGVYYFDLLTTRQMMEGEYVLVTAEGTHRSISKIIYRQPVEAGGGIGGISLKGTVIDEYITGVVDTYDLQLTGLVQEISI